MPGAVFHLTARTLDRERVFTPALRTRAIAVIAAAVPRSGARLLAATIMSNHLHLVVQQGPLPLHKLMQPVLRRLAHLIQRTRGVDGPVFWRPYGSTPCFDPDHARNAIAYTHLNPVRAHLCTDPVDYPWTTHRLYSDGPPLLDALPAPVRLLADVVDAGSALSLFVCRVHDRESDAHDAYRRFIEARMQGDRQAGEDRADGSALRAAAPMCCAGNDLWARDFSPLFHAAPSKGRAASATRPWRSAPDLADLARATLSAEGPELTLGLVRGRRGGARYARIRHAMIRRMHVAGHRNVDIAHFLGISQSAVSRVICAAG
jgi:REP element-mobilizing transposase RayT